MVSIVEGFTNFFYSGSLFYVFFIQLTIYNRGSSLFLEYFKVCYFTIRATSTSIDNLRLN